MENRTGFCNAKMKEKAMIAFGIVLSIVIVVLMIAAAFMPKGPPLDRIQQQIRTERMIQ